MGCTLDPGSAQRADGVPVWGVPESVPRKRVLMRPGDGFVFHPSLVHCAWESRPEHIGVNRLGRWLQGAPRFLVGTLSHRRRLAITIRITTPDVRIFPLAWEDAPPGCDRPVLLAGSNDGGANDVDDFPF